MTSIFLPSTVRYLCRRSVFCHQLKNRQRIDANRLLATSSSCRNASGEDRAGLRLPRLMNYSNDIIWPSFIKTIKNFVQSFMIIRPYFDQDFSLSEFSKGAEQALLVISSHLARGDTEGLQGLVDDAALREIRESLDRYYSPGQRQQLEVKDLEDVYLHFPYQVGIIMNDSDTGVQERFVEITYVFHVFRGLAEERQKDDSQASVPHSPSEMFKYKDRIMICNYRFIREFTKGVDSQWTVNLIHHFGLPE